jgi:DNA invertase Pin-like site-specific DNA recombinase
MRAAIYARVSTADGRQAVENQLAELRRFAATQGWEIDKEYIDHESGGRAERREFRRLLDDAAQRRFNVVLFWALDRFTREGALETLKYLDQFTRCYRSFTEPCDSCGMFKDAIIAILGTIAKQERIRLSERIRAGLDRVRAHGTRSGRPIGRPRAVFRRDEALKLWEAGYSWRQITSRLGAGVTTIRRACS